MPSSSLPRQLARTRRVSLGAPDRFTIASDGGTVLLLRSRAGDDPLAQRAAAKPDLLASLVSDPVRKYRR